jgi:acetyltransferase-like isoleucine patch superfamily enzyme
MTPVYVPPQLAERAEIVTLLRDVGELVEANTAIASVRVGDKTHRIGAPISGYLTAYRTEPGDFLVAEEPIAVLDTVDDEERRAAATQVIEEATKRVGRQRVQDASTPPPALYDELTSTQVQMTDEAARQVAELHLDPIEIMHTLVRFKKMARPGEQHGLRLTEKHVEEYLRTGTELAIVGANDEALVLLDIIRGSDSYSHYAVSIYDDEVETHGRQHGGALVVGGIDKLGEADGQGTIGLIAVAARGPERKRLVDRLYNATYRAPLLPMLSAGADIAEDASIEMGSTVCAGAVIGIGATLGLGCYIGYGAIVGAFATLGDHCEIGEGGVVGARSTLGARVRAYPGTCIPDRAEIGKGLDLKPSRMIKRDQKKGTR